MINIPTERGTVVYTTRNRAARRRHQNLCENLDEYKVKPFGFEPRPAGPYGIFSLALTAQRQ